MANFIAIKNQTLSVYDKILILDTLGQVKVS